jgi:hypothetical protein
MAGMREQKVAGNPVAANVSSRYLNSVIRFAPTDVERLHIFVKRSRADYWRVLRNGSIVA